MQNLSLQIEDKIQDLFGLDELNNLKSEFHGSLQQIHSFTNLIFLLK